MDAASRGLLLQELKEQLTSGHADALSGPRLIALVEASLQLPSVPAAAFGWKLLAAAAMADVVDERGKRPLAAARHLLGLVELPLDAHTPIVDLGKFTWKKLNDLSDKVFPEAPPRLPLNTGQRQTMASLAADYGADRGNLVGDKPRLREVASFLLDGFLEQLEKPANREQARRLARHHFRATTPLWKQPAARLAAVVAGIAVICVGVVVWPGSDEPSYAFAGSLTAASSDSKNQKPNEAVLVRRGGSVSLHLKFRSAKSNPVIPQLSILLRFQRPTQENGQSSFIYATADPGPTTDVGIEGANVDLNFNGKQSCGSAYPVAEQAVQYLDLESKNSVFVDPNPKAYEEGVGYVSASKDAQLTLTDTFASYSVRNVTPGAMIELRIPISLGDLEEQPGYAGNALEFRTLRKGDDEFQRTGTVRPSDTVRARLSVYDYSCNTKPIDLLTKVAIDNSGNGFSRLRATLEDPSDTRTEAGSVLINFAGAGDHELKYVPGSTEYASVTAPSCSLKTHKLDDGIAQGGIIVKKVVGFIPFEPCDEETHFKYLLFNMTID